MRVFATTDPRINLTAREAARRAEVSCARALEVLRELTTLGIVATHELVAYRFLWYEEQHPLGAAVRELFEAEAREGATRA